MQNKTAHAYIGFSRSRLTDAQREDGYSDEEDDDESVRSDEVRGRRQ